MAEKTEKATPKKLRDAMQKGQVAKSQDFPAAFTFIVSLAMTLWWMDWIYGWVAGFTANCFGNLKLMSSPSNLPIIFYNAAIVILKASLPICGITACMGMIVNFCVTGPVWAPKVFQPDIKKFNPIDNLKAKFKAKTWFELAKSIFKISGAGTLIYFTVRRALPELVKACTMPLLKALFILSHFMFEVIYQVGIFFITVAIADLIWQKKNFAKEMKMEKFDVKQEYKNTEGNPQIKSKRKQIAQEIAYQESPLAGVKKARAIVVNPVHLAIAIGYERDIDPAPFIIAIGKDFWAEQICKEARTRDIPILRNIGLAHDLWEKGEEWEYVPEHTFEVMAGIIMWADALKEQQQHNEEEDRVEPPAGCEPEAAY